MAIGGIIIQMHKTSGTKVILLHNEKILAIQRDNDPAIPYPGKWDLPGGGAEPGESLLECAYREVEEELGLNDIPLYMLEVIHSKFVEGKQKGRALGFISAVHVLGIRFGAEGQRYGLFTVNELADIDFVPELRDYICENQAVIWTAHGQTPILGAPEGPQGLVAEA